LELKSDSFSYRTELHSIPKLQHYRQEHIATSAWFTPDQECLTSILLNVRYAVIGWNLVSLGTLTDAGQPLSPSLPDVAAFRAPEHLFQSEDAIELLAQLLEALEMGLDESSDVISGSHGLFRRGLPALGVCGNGRA
jgi:hypothetical protein